MKIKQGKKNDFQHFLVKKLQDLNTSSDLKLENSVFLIFCKS